MLVLIVMASIATIWFWVRIWTKPEFAIETILVPMPRSAVPSMEKNSDTGSQAVLPSIEKLPETESQLVVPTHSANQAHTVGATNAEPATTSAPAESVLMRKFSLYDSSAKSAMDDIKQWAELEDVSLPLIPNLVENRDPSRKPKICVGIQTAERPHSPISYLRQCVVAMLARMDFSSLDEVYIHAFGLRGKGDFASVSDLVPVTEIDLPYPETLHTVLQQSRLHALILRQLQGIGCEHIIMLEDDALATLDWVDRVKDAVSQVNERRVDWLMIKLYTARSFGDKASSAGLNSYDQMFGAVAYLINKLHVIEFADTLDAAVVAVEAGKQVSPEVDLVIIDFSRQKHRKAVLAFEPVVFQHTGIYSAANPGRTPAEFEAHWGMQSRDFAAEGQPIAFNAERWKRAAALQH